MSALKSLSRILRKIVLCITLPLSLPPIFHISICRRILSVLSFVQRFSFRIVCLRVVLHDVVVIVRTHSRNCSHAGNSLLEIPGVLLRDSFDFRFTGTRRRWTIVMDPSLAHAIIIMDAQCDDITWFGPSHCAEQRRQLWRRWWWQRRRETLLL